MNNSWVLVSDSMDYDDPDTILGVFATLQDAQESLARYIQGAIEKHPSNTLLLKNDYTITRWVGFNEIEVWTKRGNLAWCRFEEK